MRILILGLLSFSISVTSIFSQKHNKVEFDENLVVPGQYVVKLKPNTSPEQINEKINSLNLKVLEMSPAFKNTSGTNSARTSGKMDLTKYHLLSLDKSHDVNKVISSINSIQELEYVEPILVRKSTYTPNDDFIDQQTHLDVIKAFDAWDITKGSNEVVVAIIDSGVDYEHEDLENKLYLNADEIPDNGIDDDGDGFVDNYKGWDFAGDDFENIVQDNDPIANADNIDHGTAVAGCSAADTDNGVGVTGIGFNAKYMALKCSADNDTRGAGGTAFILNAIFAVMYAADNGADVINMSYGGPGFSQFEQDVFTYAALEKDVVLVAAAGNDGVETISYPGGYEHVISVAATNDDDSRASFTQYGPWVDISAPGVAVFTTAINDNYTNINGTSFSSPITAGAAALLRAQFPDYNQFQISTLLIQSADDISDKNIGFDGKLGGRLNIEKALTISTPAIRLEEFSILNADGDSPSASETAMINISFLNELDASSANTTLTITELSDVGVTLSSTDEITLGSIATDQEVSIETLSFTVPSDIAFNKQLTLNLLVQDPDTGFEENFTIVSALNPLVTSSSSTPYLLSDGGDFETDGGGFASGAIEGGVNLWERGTPENSLTTVNSGTNVWKTDLDGNLVKETYTCSLQSPVFDLSDETKEYKLSFYKSMESEFCNAPAAVQLQYTTDGVSWFRLGSKDDVIGTNWYNKDENSACQINAAILADQQGWLGTFENEYTAYNISELAGNSQVTFRFILSVSGGFDSDINDDGFMIDDFQIEQLEPSATFFTPSTVSYTNNFVEFFFLSSGAESYSWDFGDGNVSDLKDPIHKYENPGTYSVTLDITTSTGADTKVLTDYVTVLPLIEGSYAESDGGDFESNINHFGIQNVSGSAFELGSSTISGKDGTSSGDNAWVTGLEEDQYQDDSEAYIYTPEFDFTNIGVYTLSFEAKYAFEQDWDGFIIEYTTNKGESWTKLNDAMEEGWYDAISDPQAVFGAEVPIFSGSTEGNFDVKSTDVTFLNGESSVGFRFVFLTDANTTDVGLALDNFSLDAPSAGPAVAAFSASATETCTDTEVIFTNESQGSYDEITWDFGDNATPETAIGIGPHSVSYSEPGAYTVSIVINGVQNGVQTEEKVSFIEVGTDHEPAITAVKQGLEEFLLTASLGDSYQWYKDDVAISNANSQTYLANEIGTYSVEVAIGACSKFNAEEFTFSLVSGLITEEKGISVYPNPVVNGQINVLIENEVNSEISISFYSLTGQLVKSIKETNSESTFSKNYDISSLKKGIYFISIDRDNKSSVQKIIVE